MGQELCIYTCTLYDTMYRMSLTNLESSCNQYVE